MGDPNYDGYYIVWMDADMQPMDADTWIDKGTYENAIRAAARKLLQSQHLIPKDVTGFCVLTPQRWRIHRGLEIRKEDVAQKLATEPKLTRKEMEALSKEMEEKYGPPPNDED